MTLGWMLILLFVGGLGGAIAFGYLRSRRISQDPGHIAHENEATRTLYDEAARKRAPD